MRVSKHLRQLRSLPLRPFPVRLTNSSHLPTDWITPRLIACDETHPGVLRRYLTASPLRRQGIALVLSRLDLQRPHYLADQLRPLDKDPDLEGRSPLTLISHIMLHRRVEDIARTLHPNACGLTGLLGKLAGPDPLSIQNYETLVEILTHPQHRAQAAVLRYLPTLPRHAIQIIRTLPAPYISLPLLKRLSSVEQAADFVRAVELIKRVNLGVTDDDLTISLTALKPDTPLRDWVQRWLNKATVFWIQFPAVDETEMIVLRNAAAMRDAAKRFENCLEGKIPQCALGRMLYIEYLPTPAIIELECLSGGWVFEAIHGVKNAPVDPATIRTVFQKLHAAGVQISARNWQGGRYNRVARLARILDFCRDDLDLIDDELNDLSHVA